MARRNSVLVESGSGLPVAPMVDVVLLLLIFFILVSRMPAPSLDVQLPQASTAQVVDQPAVSVAISRDGQTVQVNGRYTTFADLPALLAPFRDNQETLVRISADSETDYAYVVRAMDAAAAVGLRHIALETRYPE